MPSKHYACYFSFTNIGIRRVFNRHRPTYRQGGLRRQSVFIPPPGAWIAPLTALGLFGAFRNEIVGALSKYLVYLFIS